MRHLNSLAEDRMAQVFEVSSENQNMPVAYSGVYAEIKNVATRALNDLGLVGVRIYNIRPEFSGYNIHFDGVLSQPQRDELSKIIGQNLDVEPSNINFVGFYH